MERESSPLVPCWSVNSAVIAMLIHIDNRKRKDVIKMSGISEKERTLEERKSHLLGEFIEHTKIMIDWADEMDSVDPELEEVIQVNMKVILGITAS